MTRPVRRFPSPSALAGGLVLFGVAALLPAAALRAQTATVEGVILDGAGEPVADQPVAMHRVTPAGGAEIDETTTSADGRFRMTVEAVDDALYFAATRYDERLYVGPPFRYPPPDAEYVIVVGVGGTAFDLADPGPAGPGSAPPADGAWWAWLLLPALALSLVVGHWWWMQRRRDPRRVLLVRLADLEERHAGAPAPPSAEARRAYERERDELRERIRALSEA